MPSGPLSHPDRAASTLANVADEHARRGVGPFAEPEPGAADCRIDLKLLQWRAAAAAERSARTRERLAALGDSRPDLWAGTVQDGAANGFAAALEEAIALAPSEPEPRPPDDPVHTVVITGRELRKKKDLLVASDGPRMRFSRKEGLLFVDRKNEAHSANCLRFEARRDLGTLDSFRADAGERPRIFSAQFLSPQRYVQAPGYTRLEFAGRLGRSSVGWPCQLTLTGIEGEPELRLVLRIHNELTGWRLRVRFLGIANAAILHECTPVREVIENDAGGFVTFTLVRACATLLVDGLPVATPGAACHGWLEHRFRLGTAAP